MTLLARWTVPVLMLSLSIGCDDPSPSSGSSTGTGTGDCDECTSTGASSSETTSTSSDETGGDESSGAAQSSSSGVVETSSSTGALEEGSCPTLEEIGAPDDFSCTLVIGFSQTANWFNTGSFEAEPGIEDARWGLLWHGGAGIESWADPAYQGWDTDVATTRWSSPCSDGFEGVDRVLLTVSSNVHDDASTAEAWAAEVESAVETVRSMLPNVERVVLQSVVGGTQSSPCETRASANYPRVVEALELVAAADPDVVAGVMPQVESCDEFSDAKGHLSPSGASSTAARLAACYAFGR